MQQVSRRRFLYSSASVAASGLVPEGAFSSAYALRPKLLRALLKDGLPDRPAEIPLAWRAIADVFDAYITDPSNGVIIRRPDGMPGLVSALEGKTDGGLTTFGPVLLGKMLRHDDVSHLLPSLAGYYSQEYGLFLDGVDASLCEYWYLMNITALVAGIVRSSLAADAAWTARLRSSFDRLVELAHQVDYDFDDQGYNFKEHEPFTVKDIYRQPDAIAGYSYLMLFAFDFFNDAKFLSESRSALARYQAFATNPWYEIPSGAMGSLAAARLSISDPSIDIRKILGFVLDPGVGLMRTGSWGGREVNGLMAGFSTEPPDQAYSMESMVVLPYLLPVLRYRPEYAIDLGRYALNTLANLRYFYPAYLPKENQSRPELPASFPYERLNKSFNGKSPYAAGDYDSHRSVYGGAYAMWLGEMVLPTSDRQILQIDIARTDFLGESCFPTYLLYNPYESLHTVSMSVGAAKADLYDVASHRIVARGVAGSAPVPLDAGAGRVLAVVPAGSRRTTRNGVLCFNDVPVDFKPL